jgi:hypothetical protein
MSDVGSQLLGGRSVRAFARLGFRGHGFGVFRFVWQTQFLAPIMWLHLRFWTYMSMHYRG